MLLGIFITRLRRFGGSDATTTGLIAEEQLNAKQKYNEKYVAIT